jgi:uncharacterized C2H2 Zn-finger protein
MYGKVVLRYVINIELGDDVLKKADEGPLCDKIFEKAIDYGEAINRAYSD